MKKLEPTRENILIVRKYASIYGFSMVAIPVFCILLILIFSTISLKITGIVALVTILYIGVALPTLSFKYFDYENIIKSLESKVND